MHVVKVCVAVLPGTAESSKSPCPIFLSSLRSVLVSMAQCLSV